MAGVPRARIIGMQVYNPDGYLVGTVQDVEIPLGGGEISLQVLTRVNTVERIPWNNVGSVGDIIMLKEKVEVKAPEPVSAAQPAQATAPPQPLSTPIQPTAIPPQQQAGGFLSKLPFGKKKATCPTCGRELTWIDQYQRWYCYNEGRYV
ncbi:hypothetical protein HRbin01_01418 [archaeon HR01]|nr:hypothetical protein HRbin01_01418 [archaeon HR01]